MTNDPEHAPDQDKTTAEVNFYEVGRSAYLNGDGPAPALNVTVRDALTGLPVGGGGVPIMTEFSRGWKDARDAAELATLTAGGAVISDQVARDLAAAWADGQTHALREFALTGKLNSETRGEVDEMETFGFSVKDRAEWHALHDYMHAHDDRDLVPNWRHLCSAGQTYAVPVLPAPVRSTQAPEQEQPEVGSTTSRPDAHTLTLREIAEGFGPLMDPNPPHSDGTFAVSFVDRMSAERFASWGHRKGYVVVVPEVWTVWLRETPLRHWSEQPNIPDAVGPETVAPFAEPIRKNRPRSIKALWPVGLPSEDGYQAYAQLYVVHDEPTGYAARLTAECFMEGSAGIEHKPVPLRKMEVWIDKLRRTSHFDQAEFEQMYTDALATLRLRFTEGDKAVTAFFDRSSAAFSTF